MILNMKENSLLGTVHDGEGPGVNCIFRKLSRVESDEAVDYGSHVDRDHFLLIGLSTENIVVSFD